MGLSKSSVGMGALDMGLEIHKKRNSDIVAALAGNPNVGKSTVFNAMTGMRQHTGNWAGKTVASAQGYACYKGQGYVLVDIPGCYSLDAHSAEEEVARDFLCSGEFDVAVVVCDALCLERNMRLVLQVLGQTGKVVVCVNMMDEARKKHVSVDLKKLEDRLGVPVVGTSARSNVGMEELYRAIKEMAANRAEALERGKTEGITPGEICRGVIESEDKGYHAKDRRKDKFFTGRITGIPVMLLLLFLVFWLTIVGANYPSEALHSFFASWEGKLMDGLCFLGIPKMGREMLVYGMYRVLTWVVSVMLPPMAIFFPLFTILEDSGYLPRVAFNLDKCFKKCNACGKQGITMCIGAGCNAAGVVGCRIIDSPRERLIAIITNSFMPCNGRFPTLIAVITMFFVGEAAGASIGAAFLARAMFVLGRAALTAAPAGILLWILANGRVNDMTILSYLSGLLDIPAKAMGLDGVILLAFLLGLPANEIVVPIMIMAYLSQGSLAEISEMSILKQLLVQNGWTWTTAVSVMLFTLVHWPCATTCLTIRKETGSLKWTFLSFMIPTILGCAICVLFHGITMLFAIP